MGKELVISADRHETRVAVLEDDQLVEIYFQRANEYSLAGSIHKGRVTRVLPGMQSAFVDIGLERDAFLYVSDFFEENEEYDKMPAGDEVGRRFEKERAERKTPPKERVELPAAVAEQPAADSLERGADMDSRDRRGRRSRRRRNRGRGFPESKYAPEPEAAPSQPRAEEERPQAGGDFMVLPGESLAKYSQEGPAEAEDDVASGLVEEPGVPADSAAVMDAESVLVESVVEEPVPFSPVEAQPVPETAEFVSVEPEADSEDVAEPGAELEAGNEPVLEELEGAVEDVQEEPAEAAAGEQPATADVRDSRPLYTHRVSRRVRRRMRLAAGESRPEEAPAGHARRTAPGEAPAPFQRAPQAPAAPEGEASRPEKSAPSISDLLREGQEILVQIAKEPLGQKGARITSHIALPGRYCVYMPTVDHLGVSRKISSDEERLRLRRILQAHRTGIPGGFIVRTVGSGRSEQDIAADMMYLYNLWLDIRQKAERKPAPLLAHHDLDIVQRLLRDQLSDNFKAIWVDHEQVYESVLHFVERVQPSMVPRVKMYTRPAPIFDAFNITAELEKALRPRVWLKSGGYIVVNQTEALVAIDINTGKFVGKSSTRLEDTIVKTNIEAIKEIVRQLRLRDLGGIIVIDFIDMEERKNRQKVFQALEEEMRNDRAPYKILQFNDFGLVAITRKRVKQSLERTLCAPCPTCEGAGYVKSVQTVIGEVLQEAHKVAGAVEGPQVSLRVHPDVARVLKSTGNDYLEELEEILKRPVLVTGDGLLHPEKFDMA
jgi:ribonuclease G